MANARQVKKNLKKYGQPTKGKNRISKEVYRALRSGPHDPGTCSNDECIHVDCKKAL